MSTPIKPWERKDFVMNQNSSGVEPIFGGTLGSHSSDSYLPSAAVGSGIRPVVTALGPGSQPQSATIVPPPLPQRNQQRSYNGYNSYAQPYSRVGYSSYGMGYPYGGYPRRMVGGYGLGYSGLGSYQDEYDAPMMQAIDESCQQMFGPFDALVRSVSSIAMVLDSTHQAMQFSFRTVLSAAESLSKLKNLFIELASSFSIIKLIKTFYYKILRLLGLISGKTLQEKQWAEMFDKASSSIQSAEAAVTNTQPKQSPWLALGFFSLMMGGPYLMFKLFAHNINKPGTNDLKVGPDSVDAVVVYDFDATTDQEMSMKIGDRLKVSRNGSNSGWALATNGVKTGFVPLNRLQLISLRNKVKKIYLPAKNKPVMPPCQVILGNQTHVFYPNQTATEVYPVETNVTYSNQNIAIDPNQTNEDVNPLVRNEV